MQATDALIGWSGASRSTVGICEHSIHSVAAGPTYSALFGFPSSGFVAVGRTDSRKAPRAMCHKTTRPACIYLRSIGRGSGRGIVDVSIAMRINVHSFSALVGGYPDFVAADGRTVRAHRWRRSQRKDGNCTKGLCTRLKLRSFVHLPYS